MMQYFDKDFFKFLLGFAALVVISITLIISVRLYESSRPSSIDTYAGVSQ